METISLWFWPLLEWMDRVTGVSLGPQSFDPWKFYEAMKVIGLSDSRYPHAVWCQHQTIAFPGGPGVVHSGFLCCEVFPELRSLSPGG